MRRQTLCTSKDETVPGQVCDTTSQWLDQSQDVFYLPFIIVIPLFVDNQDCFYHAIQDDMISVWWVCFTYFTWIFFDWIPVQVAVIS